MTTVPREALGVRSLVLELQDLGVRSLVLELQAVENLPTWELETNFGSSARVI